MKKPEAEWQLLLYIAGQTPKSIKALSNIKKYAEEHLHGIYGFRQDVLYIIRSIAPWAQIVYIQGDMDPHAIKCITAEPRYREEIIGTTMYIAEAASVKYYIVHGHQGEIDQLRKSIGAGPWDWLIIGQYKRLEVDKLARVIYNGGITREFPPEARGYLVITDSNYYIKTLKS